MYIMSLKKGGIFMISVKNLFDNDDVKIIERKGNISVVEFQRDVSVNKLTSMSEYFAAKMNVKRCV